jgi:GH18 family chitinase
VNVFCYVETLFGGVRADALDLSACTHVIEAFLLPSPSGEVRAANGLPREPLLAEARRQRCRVLAAVGGATVPGPTFAALAADPRARRRFAEQVTRFAIDAGYDGVDLDWEFPTVADRGLQVELVHAVRRRLDEAFAAAGRRERPLVVLGVTPGAHLEGYDFRALAGLVDDFIQFGYDFHNPALGPWASTASLWPDGATRPVEASVRGVASELLRRGVPRSKLIVALPLYAGDGRAWVEVRKRALATPSPVHPLFLESPLDDTWVTGPAALEAKIRKILAGSEIEGGGAAGIALWQLGHQGTYRDLTAAVRHALGSAREGGSGGGR